MAKTGNTVAVWVGTCSGSAPGGMTALHGDGDYASAFYFTSEAEAREGERKEMPADMKAIMSALWDEQMALHESGLTFYDLHEPGLLSHTQVTSTAATRCAA